MKKAAKKAPAKKAAKKAPAKKAAKKAPARKAAKKKPAMVPPTTPKLPEDSPSSDVIDHVRARGGQSFSLPTPARGRVF